MEKGGRTKRVAEEYRGLRDLGHEVRLVVFGAPPDWVRDRHDPERAWSVCEKGEGAFDFRLLVELRALVRDFKPELIDAHCEASALYGGLVGRWTGVPCFATVHRSNLEYYRATWRSRLFFRFVRRVIAVSEQRKALITSALGLPPSQVHVVHWGIVPDSSASLTERHEARQRLGLGPGPLLLSIGHLGAIKGHDDSLLAMAMILRAHPDARLYIAGDGSTADYDRLRSRAAQEGVDGAVVLLGQISDVYEWLRASDIFLQPSREEAFGLVFLEAGLCERPTVSTRVGGIPEIIEDGRTGLLVPPREPAAVADAVLALLDSPERARAMGEAARQRVLENFSLNDRVRALARIFEEALEIS